LNYYNNSLDFLGKPILKNNKLFKTSQKRINYFNTDENKKKNLFLKSNYKNNNLYHISSSIPLFNLKENSYRRYHQSLNKEIKFYSNAIKNNNIIFNRPISNIYKRRNYNSNDLITPSFEKKTYDNLFIRKNNFFNAYLNNYHNRKASINDLFDNNEGYFNF
jgi:cupin superfamily acireductone dioxygenase involved in methionine salvage